jgi:hypothetical protein
MHAIYIIIPLLNASIVVRNSYMKKTDRLHHAREEHQKELDYRTHRDEYKHKVKAHQEQVDEQTRNFSDNF